jgi:hypothetical protein
VADAVFNISKGAFAEKVRDAAANVLVLLLKSGGEADAGLRDRDTVADILTASTEADATNYARKTALTGTVTVDDTNDRVDVSIPNQTWTALGGATNNTLAKLIVAYQDAAADATRVPMTHHDFALTTDGSDVTVQFAAAGFGRAS